MADSSGDPPQVSDGNKCWNPSLTAKTVDIKGDGNFPQGCLFSPDGLCLLTSTASDHKLRLYNTPAAAAITSTTTEVTKANDAPVSKSVVDWKTSLSADGCDSVRSYSWYPHMNSSDPSSCCFLSASRGQPVHLVDAYTSEIRASYRPYNALDEMESPTVTTFSPDGQRIFAAGFRSDRTIHVFDTANPGRDSTILRLGKTRRSSDGQKGLISALVFSPPQSCCYNSLFAVGTYAPGSIYLYDNRVSTESGPVGSILNGVCVAGHGGGHSRKKRRFVTMSDDNESDVEPNLFSAARVRWFHSRARGGVTQLRFSPTEDYTLYSASRRSDAVLSWDVRMSSGNSDYASCPIRGLSSFATDNNTNQRIEFDFDETGRRLFVGGRDKCVRVYNVDDGKLVGTLGGLADVANGVSYAYNARENCGMLAVATGARRFPSDEGEEVVSNGDHQDEPGSLEFYRVQ